MLKELHPGAKRVGFLGLKTDWEAPSGQVVQTAARTLGLTLTLVEPGPRKTVKALGTTIPPSLLARADEVIE